MIRSGNGEPEFNIGECEERKTVRYAIKLFENKDIFMVWDLQRHRDYGKKGDEGCYLSLTEKNWDDIPHGMEVFEPRYKHLNKPNSGIYEKIYIVGISHFHEFFQNYTSYMKFNEEDDEFPHDAKEDEKWADAFERRKYSSRQSKRDRLFREKVLEAYEYQCAICRCEIREILQAAHEHGYEVRDTAYDDPKHGICLCANHHLMYDSDVIDINLKTRSVEILKHKEEIKNSTWYKEFSEKYSMKIKERK